MSWADRPDGMSTSSRSRKLASSSLDESHTASATPCLAFGSGKENLKDDLSFLGSLASFHGVRLSHSCPARLVRAALRRASPYDRYSACRSRPSRSSLSVTDSNNWRCTHRPQATTGTRSPYRLDHAHEGTICRSSRDRAASAQLPTAAPWTRLIATQLGRTRPTRRPLSRSVKR
jgi:hypothetical protein